MAASEAMEVSVVTPTYREAENIPYLVKEVHAALTAAGLSYELIVADDVSGDETAQVCGELAARFPLRLLSRRENRGLSPAVIDGIAIARGRVVVVMDADLSHPPEKVAEMARLLLEGEAEFVVGSRYVKGGGLDERWPWRRRVNSWAATLPARGLVPLADPMSGFFGLRRADMPAAEALSPIGYKIGLELLVKAGFAAERVREVPILFRDRVYGESKMSVREMWNYVLHLRRLYHYRWPRRTELAQFAAVGAVGLAVDVAAYLALVGVGMPHLWARAAAFLPAVTCNWALNRVVTFAERPRRPMGRQWVRFVASCLVGLGVSWGVYAGLTGWVGFFDSYRVAALGVGVVAGMGVNFVFSERLVFGRG